MAIANVRILTGKNQSAASLAFDAFAPGAVGNLIWIAAGVSISGHTMGISDTQGHVWNPANPSWDDSTNGASGTVMQSWWTLAKNTNSTTITVTNSSPGFISITGLEFSGVDQSSPLDQVTHSPISSTGTNCVSPAFTPRYNDEVVCAYCDDNINAVGNIDGSAATMGSDDLAADWSEFRVLTGRAGVSMTAAFTGTGGAYGIIVATFRPPQPTVDRHVRPFPYKPGGPPARSSPYR